jgi:hypothetical protein
MREWTVLFTEGKPLFEPAPPVESTEPTPEQILEQERQKLLDETDFMEYKVNKIYILKKEIEHNIFTFVLWCKHLNSCFIYGASILIHALFMVQAS